MDRVVFDFDGVIVRNKQMGKIITQRSERFVEQTLNCPPSKSTEINRALYTRYGHTALGVASVLRKDPREVTFDFNEFVYKNFRYHELHHLVQRYDRMRMHEIRTLYASEKQKAGLFTNAPLHWCENVTALMQTDLYDIMDPERCITSDNMHLKPNWHNYQLVEQTYADAIKNEGGTIHFVDDSFINIMPLLNREDSVWRFTHLQTDSIEMLKRLLQ